MNIAEVRKKIDQIDAEILKLIKQRLSFLPEIVEYKKKHNLAVFQEKREQMIYANLQKISEELGVNYELVKNVWGLLIQESHRIENDRLAEKDLGDFKLKVDFEKLKIQRKKIN